MTDHNSGVGTVIDAAEFDLADPHTHLRPDRHAIWRRIRETRPVYRVPDGVATSAYWVVAGHDDVLAVYRDDEHFTSEHGNMLITLMAGKEPAAGKMLAVTDGLRHREVRNLVLKSVSPRALGSVIEAMRQRARRVLADTLARAADGATVDFATEVGENIPLGTICDLLGVPESDRAHVLRLSKNAFSSDDAAASRLAGSLARHEVLLYFSSLAKDRRSAPGSDVLSALLAATVGGKPLDVDEVVYNCYSLTLGGEETSRLAMIGAVEAFSANPEQWRSLRDGSVGVPSAVEEVLRWTTPSMHFGRRSVAEVRVGDMVIPPGEAVTLWNISANRDERVFADPETFDLGRSPNRHVSFGYGPHFCVGALLARAELTAVIEILRAGVRDVSLAGEPRRIYSNFLTGYCHMPVAFDIDPAGLRTLSAAVS